MPRLSSRTRFIGFFTILGLGMAMATQLDAATIDYDTWIGSNTFANYTSVLDADPPPPTVDNLTISYRSIESVTGATAATAAGQWAVWNGDYSGNNAIFVSLANYGEIRFEADPNYFVRVNSVILGGWPNLNRNIEYAVYTLSGTTPLTAGTANVLGTTPFELSLATGFSGNGGGFLLQFGPDIFNGGVIALNLDVEPVPVPAALPLMATALAGLGFLGWRQRAQHTA